MNQSSKVMLFLRESNCFESTSLERTELLDGEILVKVLCCTICGSDLHTFEGRRSGPSRCVLGHEIVGEVLEWGGSNAPVDYFGKPVRVGQRITWTLAVGCGKCFFCVNNLSQKCVSLFKYGHEQFSGNQATGGLSEYCNLVPGTPVFPLPESLPDEVACPANCATATVAASLRLARETHSPKNSVVLVTGIGMLGLTALAMLSELGAKEIVAVDANPARLELATHFGATRCVSANNPKELSETLLQASEGRGADIALDFAGVTPAVNTCLDNLRVGGLGVFAGTVFPSEALHLPPEDIVRKMLTIRGIHNYLPCDLADALEFLGSFHTKYPFASLVAKSFALESSGNAFQHAIEAKPVRVAVRPATQG